MRFVLPETVRLTLPSGDWIEIKKELTIGEDRKYRAAGFTRRMGLDASIEVDWQKMAVARVQAYLVDWSAKGPDGKDLPVSPSAIEALSVADFEAIDAAIVAHIESTSEEKKPPAPPEAI